MATTATPTTPQGSLSELELPEAVSFFLAAVLRALMAAPTFRLGPCIAERIAVSEVDFVAAGCGDQQAMGFCVRCSG